MAVKARRDPLDVPKIALINSSELLRMLGGIARRTLEKWIDSAEFPAPIMIGVRGRQWWVVDEVLEWIAKRPRLGGEAKVQNGKDWRAARGANGRWGSK